MEPVETISLQEAADRLGVHYMTAYRYVRLGLLPASKDGGAWRVAAPDVERVREHGRQQPSRSTKGRRSAPWSERLCSRLAAGDEAGSWGVVESALASGHDAAEIYLDVLAPAMVTIGERWESGELDVSVEHGASVIAQRIVGRLGPRFARRGRSRGTVVLGAAPGERHGLPVALLADLLRGAGYTVVDLGADVPLESFATAVRIAAAGGDLVAVGISATTPGQDEVVAETVAAVRAAAPAGTRVLAGGRAVPGSDEAEAVGADGWAPDGRALADLLRAGT